MRADAWISSQRVLHERTEFLHKRIKGCLLEQRLGAIGHVKACRSKSKPQLLKSAAGSHNLTTRNIFYYQAFYFLRKVQSVVGRSIRLEVANFELQLLILFQCLVRAKQHVYTGSMGSLAPS